MSRNDWAFLFAEVGSCLAKDFGPEIIATSKAKVPKDSGALNDGEVLKAAIA